MTEYPEYAEHCMTYMSQDAWAERHLRLAEHGVRFTNGMMVLLVGVVVGITSLWVFPDPVLAYKGDFRKVLDGFLAAPGWLIFTFATKVVMLSLANFRMNRVLLAADYFATSSVSLFEWALAKLTEGTPDERDAQLKNLLAPRFARIEEEYAQTDHYLLAMLKEEMPAEMGTERPDSLVDIGTKGQFFSSAMYLFLSGLIGWDLINLSCLLIDIYFLAPK